MILISAINNPEWSRQGAISSSQKDPKNWLSVLPVSGYLVGKLGRSKWLDRNPKGGSRMKFKVLFYDSQGLEGPSQ
ncbi:unnamed protein product [Linum trigynum]|uniref:Uncharacterized protein n=1 Tax=Linum trigynum TaxID=586398 RepID=A0AAV2EEN7_9ROSI